jgi:hypothetical protein
VKLETSRWVFNQRRLSLLQSWPLSGHFCRVPLAPNQGQLRGPTLVTSRFCGGPCCSGEFLRKLLWNGFSSNTRPTSDREACEGPAVCSQRIHSRWSSAGFRKRPVLLPISVASTAGALQQKIPRCKLNKATLLKVQPYFRVKPSRSARQVVLPGEAVFPPSRPTRPCS